jgi:hypothetical protein
MYIINEESVDSNKVYGCNKLIANWLIYTMHFPLLSRKDKVWYFARTSELEKVIKRIPFYLKIPCKL